METTIKDYLLSTNRQGIQDLISYMEYNNFFKCPCSSSHHLAKEGGLAEHSLNVLDTALMINNTLETKINYDSLVIAALLHDLGKMGDYGKVTYVENILKNGSRSESKPYEINKDLSHVDHEIRSIAIANRFIRLTEEEEFAILYHNGLYGNFKYVIPGKETPLYLILHFADMWAARILED